MSNNPLRILQHLDSALGEPLELTIYGRAALALGYERVSRYGVTMDVDVILPAVQVEAMDLNESFWTAVEQVNHDLEAEGLYLTHIFLDEQIILRPDWLRYRVEIASADFKNLRIFRPHTVDLILSKMMRIDPDDREDIRFLLDNADWGSAEWEACFRVATVPDVLEIREAFLQNQHWLLELLT